MSYRKYSPLFVLALTASLAAPTFWKDSRALAPSFAQSAPAETFPLPATVPADTKISIDGSTSMKNINQTIDEGFEKAYPGSTVTADYTGSDAALKAVEAGKIDLAAIGRNLTAAEKAQGLREVPITRHKIALITSPDNPFTGSLTIEQFAAIFHGKLTDWSKVGGPSGAIVFVDRPATSDTRSAFQNYEVFQKDPFTPGTGTVTVIEDTIEAVSGKLDKNGLSYAIVDQVANNPSVKVIKMHETLPDDPKYPFSQALVYVYKGPTPSTAVKAFLGYATAPDKQAAIEAARKADAGLPASPSPAASPDTITQAPATTAPESGGGLPGWLWWLLPLAALLALPFLLKGRDQEPVPEPAIAPVPVPPVVPPVAIEKGRMILVPRDCKNAYAYWEVSEAEKAALRRQGGEKLALRVYDVTDIDLDKQPAHGMEQYDCREADPDLQVPIPIDDRDYLAELGYVTPEGNWLTLVRSEHIHVPACPPVNERLTTAKETLADVGETVSTGAGTVLAGATALAAGAAAAVGGFLARDREVPEEPADYFLQDGSSRIVLVPRNCQSAYAYWELNDADRGRIEGQTDEKLILRVSDVTDIDFQTQPAHITQEYECQPLDRDQSVPISIDNRDYIAEIGYVGTDGIWTRLARSRAVRVPACPPGTGLLGNVQEGFTNLRENLPGTVTEARENLQSTFTNLRENLPGTVTEARENLQSTFTNLTENLPGTVTEARENLAGGAAAALAGAAALGAGAAATARSWWTGDRDEETEEPSATAERIIYVPRDSQEAYVYWEVGESEKEFIRQQGGTKLALRIYDLTDTNEDGNPDSVWEYEVEEVDRDKHIPIHRHDRSYVAELGYRTEEGRWLAIARSRSVYVPIPPEPTAE
jgi:phosphate transport system substrate-binding protein